MAKQANPSPQPAPTDLSPQPPPTNSPPSPAIPIIAIINNAIPPSEWRRLAKLYSKPCPFASFDFIRTSADEINTITDHIPLAQYPLSELFNQPSLTSFTVILSEEDQEFYVCFRPTKLPTTLVIRQPQSSGAQRISPRVDMYISLSNGATTDYVFTVGFGNNEEGVEAAFAAPVWARANQVEAVPEGIVNIANIYPIIQCLMRERPQVLVTKEKRAITLPVVQHKKSSRTNKTRLVRTIHFDTSKLPKRAQVYTCRKWSVAGYYRTNKNGTRFFVRGHYRGPDRHNKDVPCKPKEYQLPKYPASPDGTNPPSTPT